MYFICFINHNFPIPNVSSKRLYYSWIFKNFIQIHQIDRSNCLLINCFFICFFISYFFYLSIFPLVKSLFKVFTLSFNFDVKDVFWSSKFGKNIRAFIAIASYSDLNVQLFIRNECLAIYLEGSKNRNFFQWTTVLYTSSNLFFITSL